MRANPSQQENVHLSSFQIPLHLLGLHWLEKNHPPFSCSRSVHPSYETWLVVSAHRFLSGLLGWPFADFNHSSVTRNQSHNPAKMLNQHKTGPRCRKDNRKPSCCGYWLQRLLDSLVAKCRFWLKNRCERARLECKYSTCIFKKVLCGTLTIFLEEYQKRGHGNAEAAAYCLPPTH